MRVKIFFLLIFFYINNFYAQASFYNSYIRQDCYGEIWDAIETPTGDYLLALNHKICVDVDSFVSNELIRLDKSGTLISTKTLNKNQSEVENIGNMHILPNGDYFIITKIFIPFKAERWLAFYRFDSNLKIIKSNRYLVENVPNMAILKSFYEPNKQRVLFHFTDAESSSFIGWVDLDGKNFKISKQDGIDFLLDVSAVFDTKNYVFNYYGERHLIDSTLENIEKTSSNTHDFFNAYIKQYAGNKYLTFSNESVGFPPNSTGTVSSDVSCKILDKNWNVVKYRSLGKSLGVRDTFDTVSFKGVSWKNPNKIFVGWNTFRDLDFSIPIEEQKTWLSLAQLDSNLNVNWVRYYFGDKFDALSGLLATSDNGILLYGRQSFDGIDSYGFAMKVNENGILASSNIGNTPDILATVNPNPCKEEFILAINQEQEIFLSLQFILFDSFGRIVKKQDVQTGVNSVSITALPNATYFYILKNNDKIVKRGKVIKID